MATLAGIVFNYFSFGRLVFKARGGLSVFGKFIVAYAMVYAVNATLLKILTERYHLSAYLAQGLCILPSVVMSWLLMKVWVYRSALSHA